MYNFLLKFLNRRLSMLLTAVWYLVLILLILYMMFTPAAELRYLDY